MSSLGAAVLARERSGTAGRNATSSRRLKLFVYPLPASLRRCDPSIAEFSTASNFQYESYIEAELSSITLRVEEPRHADLFLIPACLSQAWEATWAWDGGRLTSGCLDCLALHEGEILAHMRSIGDYFDSYPERHLVSRHVPHQLLDRVGLERREHALGPVGVELDLVSINYRNGSQTILTLSAIYDRVLKPFKSYLC